MVDIFHVKGKDSKCLLVSFRLDIHKFEICITVLFFMLNITLEVFLCVGNVQSFLIYDLNRL